MEHYAGKPTFLSTSRMLAMGPISGINRHGCAVVSSCKDIWRVLALMSEYV